MIMKIAVDVDGVLLNIIEKFCKLFNSKYKTNYTKKDIIQWEFYRDLNISESEAYDIFYEIFRDVNISLEDENSVEILEQLNKNYYIDLVSARDSQFKSNLVKNLENVNIRKDIHFNNIIMVKSHPYDVKLDYDYDIFIDDNPFLATAIQSFPKKVLLLYDQPWNQECRTGKNIYRVHDWKDIYMKLFMIKKYKKPLISEKV